MYVSKTGKRRLVYGADWAAMPGADSHIKEIRTIAKERNAKYYVTMEREGARPLVGFVSTTKGGGNLYSAAALIKQLIPDLDNAVVGVQLENGLQAAICFGGGLPMIGYDVVGKPEVVAQHVEDYLQFLGEAAERVRFLGSTEIFGYRGGLVEPFAFVLGEITDAQFANAKFKVAQLPIGLLVITLVVLGIAFGGWYAYEEHEREQRRKLAAQQVDPNELYEKNLKQMLKDAGFSVSPASKVLVSLAKELPLFQAGWRLDGAVCNPPATCASTWNSDNMPMATLAGFAENLPDGWVANYKSDFQTISVTHPEKGGEDLVKGLERSGLPKSEAFMLDVGSALQRLKPLGVQIQIQTPTLFAVPTVPQGSPPITEAVLKAPVKEGSWSATLPMWAVDSLYDLPSNMVLGTLSLKTRGRDLLIQADGKYYVGK